MCIKNLSESGSGKCKGKKSKPEDYIFGRNGKSVSDSTRVTKIVLISVAAVLVTVFIVCFVTSSKVFRAKEYQKMLNVTKSDFSLDIAEMPMSQIPIVDRDTAERLGSRKIGEVVELVSQFNG